MRSIRKRSAANRCTVFTAVNRADKNVGRVEKRFKHVRAKVYRARKLNIGVENFLYCDFFLIVMQNVVNALILFYGGDCDLFYPFGINLYRTALEIVVEVTHCKNARTRLLGVFVFDIVFDRFFV